MTTPPKGRPVRNIKPNVPGKLVWIDAFIETVLDVTPTTVFVKREVMPVQVVDFYARRPA